MFCTCIILNSLAHRRKQFNHYLPCHAISLRQNKAIDSWVVDFTIHTGPCPTYSSVMVRAVAVNRMRSGQRSADTAQYIKQRCRTEIGKRAFSYAGPLAWNDLPPLLHCISDSKRFRKHLKHIILIVLPSTHCNACLDNYVGQAM